MKMMEHCTQIILLKVEIKDYNVMIGGKSFYDQPINSNLKTYKNIRESGQGSRRWLHNWLFVRLFLL